MKLNEDLIIIEPFEAKEKIEEIKAQIEESKDWRVRKNLLTLLDIYLFQTLYDSDHKEETNCNIDKKDWEEYSNWNKEQAKKLYAEHPELEQEDKERDAKIEASVKDNASGEVKEQEEVEENLELKEANYYDQVDKMKQLENGTRGFNAKAASDSKLRMNQQICISHNLQKALSIVEAEMIARGLIKTRTILNPQPQPAPQPQRVTLTIELGLDDFHTADGFFVRDAVDTSEIIKNSMASTETIRHLLISLIWALCLQKPSGFIQALKVFLVNNCNYSEDQIKETINKCLNNPDIITRLNQGTKDIKNS